MTLTVQQMRAGIVEHANWAIANHAGIHYRMKRPMDSKDNMKAKDTPFDCDCSEGDTDLYFAGGAPDPNGLGYNGYGNTATILDHGIRITQATAQVGDHVVYVRPSGESVHVAVLIEKGSDPILFSHGQESGPIRISLHSENAYHASVTAEHPSPAYPVWVRTLPLQTPARYRWRIADASGRTLGYTIHPALWSMRHPMAFRNHGAVRFNRQVRD